MITENLTTLKINKLTKEKYQDLKDRGDLGHNEIYLIPEEPLDLSDYLTETEASNVYATKAYVENVEKYYAGGTQINLNGESQEGKIATIFAPESSGTQGYFLRSNGDGAAPVWRDPEEMIDDLGFSGSVTSIIDTTLAANKVVGTDADGKITVSNTSIADLDSFRNDLTAAIDNGKKYTDDTFLLAIPLS